MPAQYIFHIVIDKKLQQIITILHSLSF